jgi:hypothetical protein
MLVHEYVLVFSLNLCEMHHLIFVYGTREETTVGHMVVHMVIRVNVLFIWVTWIRRDLLSHINIHGETLNCE